MSSAALPKYGSALEPVLQALEGVAQTLNVKVRYEGLSTSIGPGGLCKLRGEYRVIIDKRASTAERVATLARSLGKIGVGDLALSRPVREAIARYAPPVP